MGSVLEVTRDRFENYPTANLLAYNSSRQYGLTRCPKQGRHAVAKNEFNGHLHLNDKMFVNVASLGDPLAHRQNPAVDERNPRAIRCK